MTAALRLSQLRETQQGQALVLSMVLLSAALIAFTRYFYTGQAVAARNKQTHALDAAAYSGALVQARALNMLAHVNRAQAGHQIAMAHLVTLASWAHFGGTQAQQLARGNPPAYLIAMLFGPEHGAAYLAASRATGFDFLARPQGDLATAYAGHERTVHQVLAAVQEPIVHSVPQARYEAMQAVLARTYGATNTQSTGSVLSNMEFRLLIENDGWPGFLKLHPGLSLRPFINETASLYAFLKPRNHTQGNDWVVDARCPTQRHELRRRGHTELDAQGQWQSTDTQSFHALRSNRWIGCYFREYAMGWGWIPTSATTSLQQPHVADPPEDFSKQDFWRWVHEHTDWDIATGSANAMANSRAAAAGIQWGGGGLPAYFDTRSDGPLRVGFVAVLTHPGPEGLQITTRSAAESFFDRPLPRSDGRDETANVFHPYWQARLWDGIRPASP